MFVEFVIGNVPRGKQVPKRKPYQLNLSVIERETTTWTFSSTIKSRGHS